jgi:FAD/FMN-containing dehydrogenase
MNDKVIRQLRRYLPDRISTCGDARYVAATSIWAKQRDRRPRAIVHGVSAADIQHAVRIARDCALPLSVRGRGHDWAGRSLCDGIVIDMRAMKDVAVIDGNTAVKAGGGASASNVLDVLDPLDLAVVTGSSGFVGMAGLTLGGGYGPLIGRFGLALDNLLAAEIVLADGRVVPAHAGQEDELFWALRGGGGNFGVVTEMTLRAHRLPSVHFGTLIFRFDDAKRVLKTCIELAASAPDELTFQIVLISGPDGSPVVMIVPTWSGDPGKGRAPLDVFARLGEPLFNALAVTSYKRSLTAFDPHVVNGNQVIVETCWLHSLDEDSVHAMVDAMSHRPSPGCAIVTHEFKGLASRVPEAATAFGLRRDHLLIEIIALLDADAGPTEEERHWCWVRATMDALSKKAIPGGYANLLARDCEQRAAQGFGKNAARLAEAKRRYDPDNVFRSAIPIPASR